MAFQIVKGTTGYVNPAIAALDTGWVINGIYAVHGGCNQGYIESKTSLGLIVGRQYTFKYKVENLTSGQVYIIAGANNGISRTTNGIYIETIIVTSIGQLSFFSDGVVQLSVLSFYDTLLGPQPGVTISFNEKENKWGAEYSFQPERLVRFLSEFLVMKDGQLWKQNVNPIYNNFFGIQYSSQVTFVVNEDYQNSKLWYNIRLDSKGGWYVQNMTILPNDQFPNGMQTLMTKANLKSIDGKLWGDILRDITDPNFAVITDPDIRAANALFRGRLMQGEVAIVTLQCDDTTAAEVTSAEFYYTDVKKSL